MSRKRFKKISAQIMLIKGDGTPITGFWFRDRKSIWPSLAVGVGGADQGRRSLAGSTEPARAQKHNLHIFTAKF